MCSLVFSPGIPASAMQWPECGWPLISLVAQAEGSCQDNAKGGIHLFDVSPMPLCQRRR